MIVLIMNGFPRISLITKEADEKLGIQLNTRAIHFFYLFRIFLINHDIKKWKKIYSLKMVFLQVQFHG